MVYRLLTDRQAEYLRLACQGLTEREIADQLGVSVGNVRYHRAQVRYRIRVATIAEVCQMIETGETPEPLLANRRVEQAPR